MAATDATCKFQFHKGTIRTCGIQGDANADGISIP